ncbi:MAG: hypothetical protein KGJ60_05485 [Verrucomicrobiota bacterium]|nr:hypothetical protein [Verrucomicrobiota bacterium]
MKARPLSGSQCARGAVILLASLYWEGNEPAQDGEQDKRRKAWRESELDLATFRGLPGIPIRYGRRSASRNGEFTIVLGGEPAGLAKIVNLRHSLPVEHGALAGKAVATLRRQVKALAEAEGIWSLRNPQPFNSWGLVCIAINPRCKFHGRLREVWTRHFRPQFTPAEYGPGILDRDGLLQIPLSAEAWSGLDYCLAAPTKPNCPVPTPKEIAEAAKWGSYFRRTSESGITTADDAEIRKYLRNLFLPAACSSAAANSR